VIAITGKRGATAISRQQLEACGDALPRASLDQWIAMLGSAINNRAPRIISKSQKLCRHEEAAKEAAEKKNAISTIDKIA